MAITLNGLTVPDFPEGLLDTYPYAVLWGVHDGGTSTYVFTAADVPAFAFLAKSVDETAPDDAVNGFFSTGEIDAEGNMVIPNYKSYLLSSGEWMEFDLFGEPMFMVSPSIGYLIAWINHDIKLATVTIGDSETPESITILDEILFDMDKEYSVKWEWLLSMANLLRTKGSVATSLTTDDMTNVLSGSDISAGMDDAEEMVF